jgi:tetratricopeptide (TPR) repeat protein
MSQYPNPGFPGETAASRRNSNYIWVRSLRPWWRAILFLAPIVAVSLVLAWEVVRVARATSQLDTISITDLEKALRQDPNNANLVHRLGLVYTFDPTDLNLSAAVKSLQQAVELNPRHWDYWADLGTTCDFVGDIACSDEAFERAFALNPTTPALLWAVGNHYLLTNRAEMAFPFFRRLLDLAPEYLDNTFRLCLRATRDPQAIYAEVVPHGKNASVRFAFLMFLVSSADYENAMKIWGQMISGPDRSPNMPLVKHFLDFLIDHNQIQDAGVVWHDLQIAGVILPVPNPQSADLLYNGSFEGQPLNTGFDWRVSNSPDLAYDFSDPSAYKGGKCLRIDFVFGRNAEYELVNQVVRIKPNTHYQLTAYVRSDNLTSSSGPLLRVDEMGCADCLARTSDPTVGTTAWHPVDVEFTTQPQTQAVRVSFWRPKEQASSRDITGTVWLDEVALRAVEAPGPKVNQARSR